MAVDVCAEVSGGAMIGPRISFSYDLNPADAAARGHCRPDAALLGSPGSDFDFCVAGNFSPQEFCNADELFSQGRILPIEAIKRLAVTEELRRSQPPSPPPPNHLPGHPTPSLDPPPLQSFAPAAAVDRLCGKKKLKDLLTASCKEDEDDKGSSSSSSSSKSFWQFRRSASLHCDGSRNRSLFRSLQFLSRSNSTGSAANPSQAIHHISKEQSRFLRRQSPPSSQQLPCPKPHHQKPPLRKNYKSAGDGVRISPVLNLPTQYVSKATQGLLGLGSLLFFGKERGRKK